MACNSTRFPDMVARQAGVKGNGGALEPRALRAAHGLLGVPWPSAPMNVLLFSVYTQYLLVQLCFQKYLVFYLFLVLH